ncbi:MAG: AEC family transporter [Endomicrobiia bacterium]|nr:AEC family transporter [Endomicrobiia bacterium]
MRVFFELLFRVFVYIFAGALSARLISLSAGRPKKEETKERVSGAVVYLATAERFFVGVVYYFIVPAFIVFSLVQVTATFAVIWRMAASAFFVFFAGFAAAGVFARVSGREYRDVVLPIAVMNSAYLAIPVNTILFGAAGAFWSVIYNVSVTIVHFTLGAMVVKRKNKKENLLGTRFIPLELPALWALAAGVLIKWFLADSAAADFMRNIYPTMSAATLPMMLFFVGMKTARMKFAAWRLAAWGVPIRIFGGFLGGLAAARIFGLEGAAAAVCVMSSSMPSAVNAYILASKFKADEDFAASMVLGGTVLSAVTAPLVAAFVGWVGWR